MVLAILFVVTTTFAQEPEKKLESISTEPKSVSAMLKTDNGKNIEIVGTVIFTLVEVNSDETLAGNLVYALADAARRKIAKVADRPLSEIPVSLTINNVIAGFEKDTKCPDLRIGFMPMDREVAGGRISLHRLDLAIRESQRELSKLLCWYARPLREKGGLFRKINRILKGEKEEQQSEQS